MVKHFFSFILGVTFVGACAAIPKFPFKYYTLDAASFEGNLLGPTADLDKKLMECKPTEFDKAPCMVLFTADFLKLKSDYLQSKVDLRACEERQ